MLEGRPTVPACEMQGIRAQLRPNCETVIVGHVAILQPRHDLKKIRSIRRRSATLHTEGRTRGMRVIHAGCALSKSGPVLVIVRYCGNVWPPSGSGLLHGGEWHPGVKLR